MPIAPLSHVPKISFFKLFQVPITEENLFFKQKEKDQNQNPNTFSVGKTGQFF